MFGISHRISQPFTTQENSISTHPLLIFLKLPNYYSNVIASKTFAMCYWMIFQVWKRSCGCNYPSCSQRTLLSCQLCHSFKCTRRFELIQEWNHWYRVTAGRMFARLLSVSEPLLLFGDVFSSYLLPYCRQVFRYDAYDNGFEDRATTVGNYFMRGT